MNRAVRQALAQQAKKPDELTPADFTHQKGVSGSMSSIATKQADLPFALQDGRVKFCVPAYQMEQTNGTQNDDETFALDYPLADCPDTLDVVAYASDSYLGTPKSIDYDANEVVYADAGTNRDLHLFYISKAPATLEIETRTTNGNGQAQHKTLSLGLLHRSNQSEAEQAEKLRLRMPERFVAEDMTLHLRVDAEYTAALSVVDSDSGTRVAATNAVTELPIMQGTKNVDGLAAAVAAVMG